MTDERTKEEIVRRLEVGQRIHINGHRLTWTITARNDEYIVAVRQEPFRPKGEHQYTVITHSDYRYNFVGPGLILTTANTMGGGWDLDGRVEEGSRELVDALASGEWDTSHRRREWLDSIRIVSES
jgi:hypothetical protein